MTSVFAGLDIGGGSTKVGLVDSAGTLMDEVSVGYRPEDSGDDIVDRFAGAVATMLGRNGGRALAGAGIGYPGTIDPAHRFGGLGNVPALIGFPLADRLEARLQAPVRLENDASAAAIGEARFGGHAATGRMLMVTVGTGIGLGFVVDGVAQATSGGGMGDAGHLIVEPHHPRRCRLGCLGCLESVASGDALDQAAADFAAGHPRSAIALRAAADHRQASALDVVAAALDGDPDALAMLAELATWLGRAAASWTHIFAPTAIVVGGGLSAAGALLTDPLEREARRCGLPDYIRDVRFALARLGNRAGMIGAATQMMP